MMFDRTLDCLVTGANPDALPIFAVRPRFLEDFLAGRQPEQAAFLRASGFTAKAGTVALLPAPYGLSGAVLGLGTEKGPHVFGALPPLLPSDTVWRLDASIENQAEALLGFALGAYRFDSMKTVVPAPGPRLAYAECDEIKCAISAARRTWLARDLINTPASHLGPRELAEAARGVLMSAGASVTILTGGDVNRGYPALAAVGRGSVQPPHVVIGQWSGSATASSSPLVSLCGKGVCFDTGGYNLKPFGGMLRMKKDMAGAAIALGLAAMIIDADLPVRLQLRLGCVENMISGNAMRPLDVLQTRSGLTVEIGNTDAEGRLVLCDLMAEACEADPAILIDFATLTGAARVALGPDMPALFSNDTTLADTLMDQGRLVHDSVWRLPLWDSYSLWLESSTADLNNVAEPAHAGAIVAALFLQRFIKPDTRWAHFDVYGWNDTGRHGRPKGGEVSAMRAAFSTISHLAANVVANAQE